MPLRTVQSAPDLRRHPAGRTPASAAASTDSALPKPNMSCAGGRTSVSAPVGGVHHQIGQPPDHRDRPAAELALGQVGRGRQLIGQRHLGDLEPVAVAILFAGVAAPDQHPGGADGVVGLADPPRPTGGIGDDHAEPQPGPLLQGRPAGPRHWRPDPRAAARSVPGRHWTLSTPAAARVRPRRLRTIEVTPRRATVRAVSARMADARSGAATVRPSALLMILDVTTTMSPSANGPPGRPGPRSAPPRPDPCPGRPRRSRRARRS